MADVEKAGTHGRPVRIITGLSGAGKSTALRAFEDLHYFAVDGLPASLAPEMALMAQKSQMGHFEGMVIGMDLRQENFFGEFNDALAEMKKRGIDPKLIFLEAEDRDIIRRYAATRRPHPLERSGLALAAAIAREREDLAPVRNMADLVIDSTGCSIHDLRRKIGRHVEKREGHAHSLRVNVASFGFKHGMPNDADFIFDLRFLPNPYFVEELQPLSGLDAQVARYVLGFPQTGEYLSRIEDLLSSALPQIEAEGRARITIALGCTGGRHRSVALVEEVARKLRQADYPVMVEHRHLERE